MSWIKNFRLRYGLTQSQLARFTGVTRVYISVLEVRTEIPPFLERLLFDLETEFDSATRMQESQRPQGHPFQQQKRLSNLRKAIEKKKTQLARLEKKLTSLEIRYNHLAVFQTVCRRWKEKYQGHDPLIQEKINSLLAEKKVDMLRCGPEALSALRVSIIRLSSEVQASEREYNHLSQNTPLLSLE
jgi:transcriptional regulator with XRE-family HTH domain